MINHIKNQYSKKPKKRKSISEKGFKELVQILDKVFSEYIRLRDSNDNGWVRCITCGKVHFWSDGHQINCGHFIPRGNYATRYDEKNNHGQCVHCNRWKNGEWLIYEQKLIEMYGLNEVENLKQKARIGGRPDNEMMRQMISEYKEKVKMIKIDKGL